MTIDNNLIKDIEIKYPLLKQYFHYDEKLKNKYGKNIIIILNQHDVNIVFCTYELYYKLYDVIKNSFKIKFSIYNGVIYHCLLFTDKELFLKNLDSRYIPVDIFVNSVHAWIISEESLKKLNTMISKGKDIIGKILSDNSDINILIEEPIKHEPVKNDVIEKSHSWEEFVSSPHIDNKEEEQKIVSVAVSSECPNVIPDDGFVFITLNDADF